MSQIENVNYNQTANVVNDSTLIADNLTKVFATDPISPQFSTISEELLEMSSVNSVLNISRGTVHSNSSVDIPSWQTVLDSVQVSCTIIFAVINLFTVITLSVNHAGFSRIILALLRHQALIDFVVCSLASIFMLQPYHWITGFYYVDVVVCYAWHTEALYWVGMGASTYNLVLVAYERYLAVCKPFRHSEISVWPRNKLAKVILVLYVLALVVLHGSFIQKRLTKDGCLNEFAFSGPGVNAYFFYFVISVYFFNYFIPAILMGICYGFVIRQLRLRRLDKALGRSTKVDHANDLLTKTALIVTIVFVGSLGFAQTKYLLEVTGVFAFEPNSPVEKIGVFLSTINSSVSPFIYAAVMPIFRRSVARTLCCKCDKGNNRTPYQSNTVLSPSGQMRRRRFQGSFENRSNSQTTTTNTSSQQSVAVSVVEIEACNVSMTS